MNGVMDQGLRTMFARSLARMAKWAALAWMLSIGSVACKGSTEMSVTGVDPKVGHTQGDQTVRIFGRNFRSDIGYTIYFGNRKARSVTLLDSQTLLVSTPGRDAAGSVDITVRADDGNAFRIAQGFRYEDMGGSVVEKLGQTPASPKQEGSKLVY